MYLHLGNGYVIKKSSVIGIFDLDITSQSYITRNYLKEAEKRKQVINVAEDLPKSYVVCCDADGARVYLCQMAAATLLKRAEGGII